MLTLSDSRQLPVFFCGLRLDLQLLSSFRCPTSCQWPLRTHVADALEFPDDRARWMPLEGRSSKAHERRTTRMTSVDIATCCWLAVLREVYKTSQLRLTASTSERLLFLFFSFFLERSHLNAKLTVPASDKPLLFLVLQGR